MFLIKQPSSYKWPISFGIPMGEGETAEQSFTGEFKRLSSDAAAALGMEVQQFYRAAEVGFIPDDLRTPNQLAKEVLIGWEGVKDANGDEVPFNAKNLAEALKIHGCASGILSAWRDSLAGGRRKN
jgi:hypothetical protein